MTIHRRASTPTIPARPSGRSAGWKRATIAVIAAAVVAVVAACGTPTHELGGWVRQPLPTVDNVALPDVTNDDAPFEFRAPPGGVLLVYFGFTFCPDVCPTTLSDLKVALEDLGDDAARVEVAFVTVDPDRDVGDTLTGYIGFFTDGRGHALRTEDPDLLKAAAEPFGVDYAVTTNEDGEIEVGHTASLFAVDDRGRLLVTWPFGVRPEVLAADLAWLLAADDGATMEERITT